MLRAKECDPIPSPSIVITFGLTIESIKELGVVSECMSLGIDLAHTGM
jgi:hypothetical protein